MNLGGFKEPCIRWGPEYPSEERVILVDISRPTEKCRCDRYSQPYMVGGSSDAAFRCQYYSNLFSCSVERKEMQT